MERQSTQHEQAVMRLCEEVTELLGHQEQEQLSWQASRIDLMEALYTVYLMDTVRDRRGNSMTFMGMVRRACRLLHVAVPHNPYDCAARGRNRKGRICSTYLDRYRHLLCEKHIDRPLWQEINYEK